MARRGRTVAPQGHEMREQGRALLVPLDPVRSPEVAWPVVLECRPSSRALVTRHNR